MPVVITICCYMILLVGLGLFSARFFRGTSKDYFIASHSIGPFLLLMSLFGTTMTAFALVGSTGEAYTNGIGVYGKMASWSGLVHSAVFFLIGIKVWRLGQRHGYMTQIQLFRDRFESDGIGYLLFPILVALVIPYLLIGILGANATIMGTTQNAFPELFPATNGAIPPYLTGAVVCGVVLLYVFFGGLRGAAWANTFQTLVFMAMGVVAYIVISSKLGGAAEAIKRVEVTHLVREGQAGKMEFFAYCLIPLSVGMFPHIFQHWLTAKSAKSFRMAIVCHPLCIMIVWLPCILIGVWATGALIPGTEELVVPQGTPGNKVLGMMVGKLTGQTLMAQVLTGLLVAGILAAIMSSLDSQFICLGTMFTNDIVVHKFGRERYSDKQLLFIARAFICLIVLISYLLSLTDPRSVFKMGEWCFSGFTGLFPIVFAALYWKRVTKVGVYVSVLATTLTWFLLFRASEFGKQAHFLLWKNPDTHDGIMPVAVIFGVSVVSLVAVSLTTKPPSLTTLEKFFPKTKLA